MCMLSRIHSPSAQKRIHLFFDIGIIIKGVDGVAELVFGIFLILEPSGTIPALLRLLATRELGEDPHDFFATLALHTSNTLSIQVVSAIAIYALTRGIIKIFLSVQLWRERFWAFPVALVVLTALLFYQLWQAYITSSLLLVIIAFVDVIIILLIALEWRSRKKIITHQHTTNQHLL